jgi:hypothetical protein
VMPMEKLNFIELVLAKKERERSEKSWLLSLHCLTILYNFSFIGISWEYKWKDHPKLGSSWTIPLIWKSWNHHSSDVAVRSL